MESSINDCTTACSSNSSCSGATFTTNNNCTLSSGTGNVVNATNSTAIVKQGMYYSYQLQQLNQQLLDINQEINNNINQSSGSYQNNLEHINQRGQAIQQNYTILNQERQHIGKMVKDFEVLNSVQENGDINTTMYYYNYIILLVVAILLIFLLIKFSSESQQYGGGSSNYKMIACMIIVLIIILIIFYSFI